MDKKLLILVNHDIVIYNFDGVSRSLLFDGYKFIFRLRTRTYDDLINMGCEVY